MNLLRPAIASTVKGLRLHVLDWGGEGRTPLLLLHGFTGHAHAWDTLSIALQPHFHVYALDQRGHGEAIPPTSTARSPRSTTSRACSTQLGLTSLVLVGLSMGGRNACTSPPSSRTRCRSSSSWTSPRDQQARMQPSSGPPEPETWDSIEQAAQHLYRGNPTPASTTTAGSSRTASRRAPTAARVDLASQHQGAALPATSTGGELHAITPPTLVLRGAESTVLDRDVAERMGRAAAAKLRRDPARVHTLHEDNPEAVLAALRDFLGF